MTIITLGSYSAIIGFEGHATWVTLVSALLIGLVVVPSIYGLCYDIEGRNRR